MINNDNNNNNNDTNNDNNNNNNTNNIVMETGCTPSSPTALPAEVASIELSEAQETSEDDRPSPLVRVYIYIYIDR